VAAATVTFFEASVFEQPDKIIESIFRSAFPDAIRCQIFSYLDINRLDYKQATKSGTKINLGNLRKHLQKIFDNAPKPTRQGAVAGIGDAGGRRNEHRTGIIDPGYNIRVYSWLHPIEAFSNYYRDVAARVFVRQLACIRVNS
jgi:hypothetical protein